MNYLCPISKTVLMEDLIKLLEECSAAFRQTGEYRMLQTYSARETRFTFDERLAISKSVEQAFTPLFDRMKADIPTLSDTDLLFCALSTQGFETVAIAECFSVTKEAVRVRKYRLREKLDDKWFMLLFGEQKRYSSESVTLHASKDDTAPIPLPSEPIKNAKVMKEKMSFGKAIATCFSKLLILKGRARRSEFWYFTLFVSLLQLCVMLLGTIIDGAAQMADIEADTFRYGGSIVEQLMNWVFFFLTFSVTVRRLHDIDTSGWLVLLLGVFPMVTMSFFSSYIIIDPSQLATAMATITPGGMFAYLQPRIMILFIILVILIVGVILLCRPGTEGPNTYGPDPIRSIPKE